MRFKDEQERYLWKSRGIFFSSVDYQEALDDRRFVERQLDNGHTPDSRSLRNYHRVKQLESLGGIREPFGDRARRLIDSILSYLSRIES